MELRKYQAAGIESLREKLRQGFKKPIMALPTGGGKSIIFGQIISNLIENGKKVLWLVHRRNLVHQMKDVLEEHFDIHPAMIMSGYPTDTENAVQLCTIQTYHRRLQLDEVELNRFCVDADVVLVDEAHRSVSKTYKDVLDLYKDKIVMGCTATPMRADGRGLEEVYDSIVDIVGVKDLTEQKFLSPARYFVPVTINLDGVKISMGDYQVKSLERKTNTPKLIGDIVDNWLEKAQGRPTIVFCVNVKHSIAVKEAFEKAGVSAEHLDARSSDEERANAFDAMERGQITVLCNVALYQEGLDVPGVSCIVMARPTKSMGLWRQCAGRGLRIDKGKEDCMIFDHGNVIEENGFLDEDIVWSLNGKEKAWEKKGGPKEKRTVKCRVCNLVFEGSNVCPECGSPVKTFGKKIESVDAELKEVGKNRKATTAEKRMWYGMFLYHCQTKGYSSGWASHKHKERFGSWPNKYKGTAPIPPTQEFKNYIQHLNIKYAKSKKKVDPNSSPLLNQWGVEHEFRSSQTG